jgi:hypothetical protein
MPSRDAGHRRQPVEPITVVAKCGLLMCIAENDMNTNGFIANGVDYGVAAVKQIVALRKPMLIAVVLMVYCCVAAAQSAPPTITGFLVDGVKSNRAAVGATLTIQGSGFGATIGFSMATVNGTVVAGPGQKPISWSDTSIVAVIPETTVSGPVVVKVAEQGRHVSSNRPNLYIRVEIIESSCGEGPCNSGPVGTSMTLTGNGFGTQGGKVTFNGVEAVTGGWSDSSIVTTVPAGATTGPIRVEVAGQVSNGWPFTVTP